MRGGGPPVCERKREEMVADVATGATWTGDVAENRGGFGLGGVICTVSLVQGCRVSGLGIPG